MVKLEAKAQRKSINNDLFGDSFLASENHVTGKPLLINSKK
jgi:hypothetical protein